MFSHSGSTSAQFYCKSISPKNENYPWKRAWQYSKTPGLHCDVLIWICQKLNTIFPFATTGLYELEQRRKPDQVAYPMPEDALICSRKDSTFAVVIVTAVTD